MTSGRFRAFSFVDRILAHDPTATVRGRYAIPANATNFPASLAAASLVKVGYIGNKRYVRTVITKNSGTSIAAGAVVIMGNATSRPVA